MSRDRDIEQILELWFEEGPTEVADRVIQGALMTIDRTEQRHVMRVPRRYPSMPTFFKLAVAAVVVAVVGGFAFVALQPKSPPPIGAPSSGPAGQASPPVTVSSTPLASAGPKTSGPDTSPASGSAIAISAGRDDTCVLTRGGEVKCWGGEGHADLGKPVIVSGIPGGVVAIAAGGADFTCALTSVGGVKCWRSGGTPIDVAGLTSGVTAITASESSACALSSAGGVKCWAGIGNAAADIAGLTSGVAALSGRSGVDGCAITTAGGVKCWTAGQPANDVPTFSLGVTAFVTRTQCALMSAGGVKCASNNQLVDIAGLTSGVRAVAGGSLSGYTCALTNQGGVKCWGDNFYGQLGNRLFTGSGLAPVDVTGLSSGVTAIAAGGSHTCALTSGSGVKCWGFNMYGQLGNGSTDDASHPVDLTGP